MPTPERDVAGIRCGQVLERLSEYLDDDLDEAARRQIDAHLQGCGWCERFGGEVGRTIAALRAGFFSAPVPAAETRARLRRELRRVDDGNR